MKKSTRLFLGLLTSVVAYSGAANAADQTFPRHVICTYGEGSGITMVDIPATLKWSGEGDSFKESLSIAQGAITIESGPLYSEKDLAPQEAQATVAEGVIAVIVAKDFSLMLKLEMKQQSDGRANLAGYSRVDENVSSVFCTIYPDSQNNMNRQNREAAAAMKIPLTQ